MISCKDFIPAYSEFFKYLEEKHGHGEVLSFWESLFVPDGKGIPLVNFVAKSRIRGCFEYWAGSLNEEAADFTMYLNEKRGYFQIVMHHCPSKGRLLELQADTGVTPYPYYCFHCDYYRSHVEMYGLKYLFNATDVDRAACSILIYDPAVFDGRVIVDEDTEVMDRKASQNEYFHQDFHHSLSRCIHYVGEKYGEAEVRALLEQYVKSVLGKLIEKIRQEGLAPLKENILASYEKEKAPDAVVAEQTEKELKVKVLYCPVVRYMKEKGYFISPWFKKSTEYVMETVARESGLSFVMGDYDEETGATWYVFKQ